MACGAAHTVLATVQPPAPGVATGPKAFRHAPAVYAWGRSDLGQTGTGMRGTDTASVVESVVAVPREVKGLRGKWVSDIACGWNHSLVSCWGWRPEEISSEVRGSPSDPRGHLPAEGLDPNWQRSLIPRVLGRHTN